jgi:CHAT domain-containing protein
MLMAELNSKMTNPKEDDLSSFRRILRKLSLPREFRDELQNATRVIFELDRKTAATHWETLDLANEHNSLSMKTTQTQISRQLRTTYSSVITRSHERTGKIKALVVGDPGDPSKNHSLRFAREEAILVTEMLRAQGVEVTPLIGPPGSFEQSVKGVKPVTRLEVLRQLDLHYFDILHYSGHGDFDPENPERAGWVFADGLFTSRELQRVENIPALVLANSCLSGVVSNVSQITSNSSITKDKEALLLPSLVDEFFSRGVENYIGTAWPISDKGAVVFAKSFYRSYLSDGQTLGSAVMRGRKELSDNTDMFGALWAAYQHYGNCDTKLRSSN